MTDPPNKGTSQILLFDPQSGQAPGETTAQQQLHDALFRGIVESLALAVFVFDSSFAIESVFMGCLDHVGPPEQLIGLKLLEVLPSDQAERLKEAIAYVEKTGLPKRLECTCMFSPNDSRHYVGNVVRLKTGNIAMFITDNTDTYAAGINLLESERRFRALIEKATDILYALDQNLVLTFWSPGAEAALGWTAAEAVGRFGPEFVHPEDTPRMVAPAENEPLGSSLELSFRVRHKDGTYRTVEAMVRNLLADPAVKGIIVNARDVTEKLALEARSVESQKLESIGRLAGGVAHDFNNLLTVILTCGELMKSAIDEGQEIVVDDLREILAAANRAKDLTQQLLAFARRQVIAPVVVDINRLIDNQLPLLRRLAGEDIMFKVGLAPSPCNLCCDPGQLQQVLLNLVVNARDAMPRGGVLEIATDIVDIPTPSHTDSQEILHGSFIRLRVKDTGEGISDEVRAHLFEPFFTTKPKGIGVGLGLATVYGIVKQSKGVINVSSSPGYGATFDILWPKSETPPSHIPTSNTTGTKGSEIVLLVEDDRSVGQVTARILREAGYQVLYASNAEDAISAAKQQSRIDLLVTDVVMPGLDGRQVADAIVAIHHQMRVLFMSGYTQNAIVHHGVIDEGINFLPKPFTPTALLSRVRDVLSLPVSS